MAYRTLLTVARQRDADLGLVDAAAALAERLDAHLDVLCVGIDEVQTGYFFTGADALMLQTTLEQARKTADETRQAVEEALTGRAVRWAARAMVSQIGALSEVVAGQARYTDLVVLPLPYGAGRTTDDEAILEAALFSADAPVLVLPQTGLPSAFPGPVMIGWNGGDEALRAVRGALPFLKMAERVDIVVVDPPRRPADRAQPGLSLSKMLDRHGVDADLQELDAGKEGISKTLLAHAEAMPAGMIVAGAYGHSRFREAILGGATRDFLSHARTPLLLAR